MLDEFSLADMKTAVQINRSKGRPVKLEASGSVTLETVRSVAETGVDYISIGAMTKDVKAVDLSMRLEFASNRSAIFTQPATSTPAEAEPPHIPARNPRRGW